MTDLFTAYNGIQGTHTMRVMQTYMTGKTDHISATSFFRLRKAYSDPIQILKQTSVILRIEM
jgi:hypothetical protein